MFSRLIMFKTTLHDYASGDGRILGAWTIGRVSFLSWHLRHFLKFIKVTKVLRFFEAAQNNQVSFLWHLDLNIHCTTIYFNLSNMSEIILGKYINKDTAKMYLGQSSIELDEVVKKMREQVEKQQQEIRDKAKKLEDEIKQKQEGK